MRNQFWLTVLMYDNKQKYPPNFNNYRVIFDSNKTLQDCQYTYPYRTSPIFPIREDYQEPSFESCCLCFYCFDSAFPVLGRLKRVASDELTKRLWFSNGLASILLITEDKQLKSELEEIAKAIVCSKLTSTEVWPVNNGIITEPYFNLPEPTPYNPELLNVENYRSLPVVQRAVVDEFVANIAFIVPKISIHIPTELSVFTSLVKIINELIKELVYVCNPEGPPPATLNEYNENMFKKDPSLCEQIKHQVVDRLIQVNSALSYVSTQALAGAVPILERRSLIRRNSLLGIGSSIMALNSIARSIDKAFSHEPVETIVVDKMCYAAPLKGIDELPEYDSSKWKNEFSVNRWADEKDNVPGRECFPKLPYFSGRLGFREAEYSVSAAIQSITGGAGFEWSLLTVTHEMLHGHVRNILAHLFRGDPKMLPDEKRAYFYERFDAYYSNSEIARENTLDSLRLIVFTYCCLAYTHGSLTQASRPMPKNNKSKGGRIIAYGLHLLGEEDLWQQFENEYRNISEIFVHILDLHYIYASRLELYIPLIWKSWAEVPHVMGDLRQYILRSLLTISAKVSGSPPQRFYTSIRRLRELFDKYKNSMLKLPIVDKALDHLNNEEFCECIHSSFNASLILVDMVKNIFVSETIRAKLINDPLVRFSPIKEGFEDVFVYDMPKEFTEEIVISQTAYMLDRMQQQFEDPGINNLEAETAKLFLACCSSLKEKEKDV